MADQNRGYPYAYGQWWGQVPYGAGGYWPSRPLDESDNQTEKEPPPGPEPGDEAWNYGQPAYPPPPPGWDGRGWPHPHDGRDWPHPHDGRDWPHPRFHTEMHGGPYGGGGPHGPFVHPASYWPGPWGGGGAPEEKSGAEEPQNASAVFGRILKDPLGSVGDLFEVNNPNFWKGALIGAAAALLINGKLGDLSSLFGSASEDETGPEEDPLS